ncbi:MAG: flavodoxin family protein [candidate division Zixibacteria bacterium]|nr:flavodoxin family protein [candidate division Zixibacteria bacterium]
MSSKHVLILKGSPREDGNSSTLADRVAAGSSDSGAEVETFILHNMNILPCDACDTCQGSREADCIIQDDMQILYPKLFQASAIVIASPVYLFNVNAQTKLCIDRWHAFKTPKGNLLEGKKIGIILTYGDTDPFKSGAINAIRAFQDMFRYIKAEIVDTVHGTALNLGDVQNKPDLMERAYKLGKRLCSAI